MKRTLIAITLAAGLVTPALGQHHYGMRHFDHHHAHRGDWNWIAPAIIGGAIAYGLTRPATVVAPLAPVYIQPNPVYVQRAPAYIQYPTVVIDGVAYTRQVMIVNGLSQEVLVRQ